MFTLRNIIILVLLAFVGAFLYLVWLERSYQEEEYSHIEEGLYMGGWVSKPPRGTKAVLNLCTKKDPYLSETHLWKPISDGGPAPSIAWLQEMVEFIASQRKAGRKTFVHCRNGASRSGLVVIAYIMYKNNWTRDQAFEFVRSKRSQTRPNSAFMELLLVWERVLQEKKKG